MKKIILAFLLCACTIGWHPRKDFAFISVSTDKFNIVTYQRNTDTHAPVHIYIEGDGHAFNAYGIPTDDPTPRSVLVRDLAMRDTAKNVIYMSRPCQFTMSPACTKTYWTDGRFSPAVINSMSQAIQKVAAGRPIILVGYSGGAMISGLIIKQNPALPVKKWITIAGVLNHSDWTEYFGDTALRKSLNLPHLPKVPALHYVGENDETVPIELSQKWIDDDNKIIIVPHAGHNDFGDLNIDFD